MRQSRINAAFGCLLCAGAALVAPLATAAQLVKPFEVFAAGAEATGTFEVGLRTALVRATGRRDADADPALAPLLADPRRYVQLFRPAPGGLQVVYDAGALERAITEGGGRLWPAERPVVLVVLGEVPAVANLADIRALLESTALQRGLPIVIMTADAAGLPTGDTGTQSLLAAAARFEADAVLAGQGVDAGVVDSWRWSLVTAASSESFVGGASDGIHGATDALASTAREFMAQPELETWVEVSGVGSLRDYVAAERVLAGALGVDSVTLLEATGTTALFKVVARGGSGVLAGSLQGQTRLRAVAVDGPRLVYELLRD